MLAVGALTLMLSQASCVQPAADTAKDDAPETVDEVQNAIEGTTSRSDLVKTIETNPDRLARGPPIDTVRQPKRPGDTLLARADCAGEHVKKWIVN